ncbi:MAG: hypothetical protein BWY67_02085 [Bacteroidetes bacterium ADurb.Bin397]|nr:MAG: hypothetical protein BWY67_02085 [Bacteroidetes bacterium ADurb.Bin397]
MNVVFVTSQAPVVILIKPLNPLLLKTPQSSIKQWSNLTNKSESFPCTWIIAPARARTFLKLQLRKVNC